jgi:hypothetical protein
MDDLAAADLGAQHFGEDKPIELNQQLCVLGELVGGREAKDRELGGPPPTVGRDRLDSVKLGLQSRRRCEDVARKAPAARLKHIRLRRP